MPDDELVQPLWTPQSPSKASADEAQQQTVEYEAAARILAQGLEVRRILDGVVYKPSLLCVLESKLLTYPSASCFLTRYCRLRFSTPLKSSESTVWFPNRELLTVTLFLPCVLSVDVNKLVEVRQGYHTDGLHRAAKRPQFVKNAPVGIFCGGLGCPSH